MRAALVTLFLFVFLGAGYGQSKSGLAEALEQVFHSPELQPHLEAWQEASVYHLKHLKTPGRAPNTFTRLFAKLQPSDFEEWEKPVRLSSEERAAGVQPTSRPDTGTFAIRGSFRGERLSLQLSAYLPDDPRTQLSATFVLQKQSGSWQIVQPYVQMNP